MWFPAAEQLKEVANTQRMELPALHCQRAGIESVSPLIAERWSPTHGGENNGALGVCLDVQATRPQKRLGVVFRQSLNGGYVAVSRRPAAIRDVSCATKKSDLPEAADST